MSPLSCIFALVSFKSHGWRWIAEKKILIKQKIKTKITVQKLETGTDSENGVKRCLKKSPTYLAVWPDCSLIISIFGHLEQWKFAKKYHIFAKVSSQFCPILNSYSRKVQKRYKIMPKWPNFAKSGRTAVPR